MADAVMRTTTLTDWLPTVFAERVEQKLQAGSVIARLSPSEPVVFGENKIRVEGEVPRAEFVGEGDQKSSSGGSVEVRTAYTYTAQSTIRFSKHLEVMDDQHKLKFVPRIMDNAAIALQRALDYGVIHQVSPLQGTAFAGIQSHMGQVTNRITLGAGTADAADDFGTAVDMLSLDQAQGFSVSGAAMDPLFLGALKKLKERDGSGPTSRRRYPEIGLAAQNITEFESLPAAVSNAVGGRSPEMVTPSKLRALVGDFAHGVFWGVVHNFDPEIIKFGDPDGRGDLSRTNEWAYRVETMFAWYVFPERFVRIEAQ